jgi:hypothetical protein
MDRASWEQQQQLEEERLSKTLEALDEVFGVGLEDTAKFLASELGVTKWWTPEKTNASHR